MRTTKINFIAITAIGIALYVALSMTMKIPIIGHIGLDLGYIALAVYCYCYGPLSGAIVGAGGCTLVSLITSGWFPPGWVLGNILIGFVCGKFYNRENKKLRIPINIAVSIIAIFVGIIVIKTAVECMMFNIPVVVKLPKNAVAALVDTITMCAGLFVAYQIDPRINKK